MMQFRFCTYDEESGSFKLIGISNEDNYQNLFELLTFAKEHKCTCPVCFNKEDTVESIYEPYYVKNVAYVFGQIGSETSSYIFVEIVEDEYCE